MLHCDIEELHGSTSSFREQTNNLATRQEDASIVRAMVDAICYLYAMYAIWRLYEYQQWLRTSWSIGTCAKGTHDLRNTLSHTSFTPGAEECRLP